MSSKKANDPAALDDTCPAPPLLGPHISRTTALGRRVATLTEGPLAAGDHTLAVPVGSLPAGAYVVRVEADGSRSLVHEVTRERRETPGPRTAAWRGTGPNGLFAPQGEYLVELYARLDGSDRTESWELTTLMYRT